jgi:multiple sugar transport system substrate-binding protein
MRRARFPAKPAIAIAALALFATACGSGDVTPGEETTDDAPADEAAGDDDGAEPGEVLLYSTQFNPVEEADAIRRDVLATFSGEAEFVGAANDGEFIDRLTAEAQSGRGEVSLVGALHGSFVDLQSGDLLTDLTDFAAELADLGVSAELLELGRLGTDRQWYIPWVQASYVVAVNREALDYLPDGADVENLSYDDFLQWAQNTAEETGAPRFGLPAGEQGLIHRFFQGYLVPSFTGGVVTTFAEPESWQYIADLWEYVHPQSITYEFMEDPLLSGEVLVAWDHIARLRNALESRPDDFIAVSVPSGPATRAHMPVVAGLGIPSTSPNPEGAMELIRHLLSPESQLATLTSVGFFPVVDAGETGDLSPGIDMASAAIAAQTEASDATLVLLPIGLGEQGGTFNEIYRAAFERVAIDGEDVDTAVAAEADRLADVMESTGAPCWAPDPPSDGPCQVAGD